jgi:hypothetical protein
MQYTGSTSFNPGYPTSERPIHISINPKTWAIHGYFTCESKDGVEDIRHIAWSICDPTSLLVLCGQDELGEFVRIDPVKVLEY